jgi:hypothetical protein
MRNAPTWSAYLMAAGMIGALGSGFYISEALRQTANQSLLFTDLLQKPPAYYWFHGAQLCCVMMAGALAFMAAKMNRLRVGTYSALLLGIAAVYITVRGYDAGVVLTPRIVNPRGPMQCLVALIVFVGLFRKNWGILAKTIYIVAFINTGYVLYLILTVGFLNRVLAMNVLDYPVNPLFWTAAFVLLKAPVRLTLRALLHWVPFVVYIVGSLIIQTRLNLAMATLLLAAYFYIKGRMGVSVAKPALSIAAIVVAGSVCWMLVGTDGFADKINYYYESLQNRLTYDSRSAQLISFFQTVSLPSLIWGNGAEAAWNWDGVLWKGATDVGYLSVLFYGGIAELLGVIYFLIVPGYRALRISDNENATVCALIIVLFSIRMFSSEFPSLDNEYYPILLYAGHCWGTVLIDRYHKRCARTEIDSKAGIGSDVPSRALAHIPA